MYSIIALGLFGIFNQGFSLRSVNIIIKTETVSNTTIELNPIFNGATGAVHNNKVPIQSSEKQFRASNKSTALLPFYLIPSTNLTNIFSKITDYPNKLALRLLGKCHKGFKFCLKACINAYRETCKNFECEKNFRRQIKKQCGVSCDKQLESAPVA